MSLIKEIETRFPVDQWIVAGIHIWPLIRLEIHYSYSSRKQAQSSVDSSSRNNILKIGSWWKKTHDAHSRDKVHSADLREEKDCLFLIRSSLRSYNHNGQMFSVISDTFASSLNQIGLDSLTLEYEPNYNFRLPRYSKSIIVQFRLDLLKIVSKISRILNISDKNSELADFEEFRDYIAENMSEYLYIDQSWLFYQADLLNRRKSHYAKILNRVKPSVVFIIPYYLPETMPMVLACKELEIPVVDVQHGIINEYVIPYSNWQSIPDGGYELIPDFFWVWGKTQKDVIDSWFKKKESPCFLGGNLWLNLWKSENNFLIDKTVQEEIRELTENYVISILLALQPGYLSENIIKAIENSPSDWFWWIRLHPNMQQDASLIEQKIHSQHGNFNIELASRISLPQLLKNVDVNCTAYSTVYIEAKHMDVPTVFFHKNAKFLYSQAIDNGTAIYTENAQDIIEGIKDCERLRKNILKQRDGGSPDESNVARFEKFLGWLEKQSL